MMSANEKKEELETLLMTMTTEELEKFICYMRSVLSDRETDEKEVVA